MARKQSNFNKLANKITAQYLDKGFSREEAEKIGKSTAYKIGVRKYGKAGMAKRAAAGRKRAEGTEVMWDDDEWVLVKDNTVADVIADEYLDMGEDYDDADAYARRASKKMSAEMTYDDLIWINRQNRKIEEAAKNPRKNDRIIGKYLEELREYIDTRMNAAEHFAAASTAAPNLAREKSNIRDAVRSQIDPNFDWNQCLWGPFAVRFEASDSNKFYMVWVYDHNGAFRALGAYGGLGQSPRLQDILTTRDRGAAEKAAAKKLKAKERKGYFNYSAEYSNAIVQFEDGAGFSSASAPPNDIYFGSEGVEEKIEAMDKNIEYWKSVINFESLPHINPDDEDLKIAIERYIEGIVKERNRLVSEREVDLGADTNPDEYNPYAFIPGIDEDVLAAENQVFALTYWISEGINDVSEALELYLSLSDDINQMEDLELQKHPRYEEAKRLQSELSYKLDELQVPIIVKEEIEFDSENMERVAGNVLKGVAGAIVALFGIKMWTNRK